MVVLVVFPQASDVVDFCTTAWHLAPELELHCIIGKKAKNNEIIYVLDPSLKTHRKKLTVEAFPGLGFGGFAGFVPFVLTPSLWLS